MKSVKSVFVSKKDRKISIAPSSDKPPDVPQVADIAGCYTGRGIIQVNQGLIRNYLSNCLTDLLCSITNRVHYLDVPISP